MRGDVIVDLRYGSVFIILGPEDSETYELNNPGPKWRLGWDPNRTVDQHGRELSSDKLWYPFEGKDYLMKVGEQ